MKTWTKDQRKQLNVELRGQHISSVNGDTNMSTPNWSLSSSSHDNTKNNSEGHVHSGNRTMKVRQRPMSCKPKSIPNRRGFRQQQKFSSSNESLSATEMTNNQITSNKEKATAVAWAEKDNQTDEMSREINDYYPSNHHQQKGSLRIFPKRDQKEKFLIDNGVTEGIGENQVFHTTAFPVRRMTMSLQHQTSVKGKKQLMPSSSLKNNHPQEETTTRERLKCVIPATPTESTVYDSIDTERLLRLNLSDPELISQLQDELISRHASERGKYLSTTAPPSSPRVESPTAQVESYLSAQERTNDINSNATKINEKQVILSPKNNSNINLFDVSTVPSSSHSSSTDAQNTEEQIEKVPESDRKDNKCSFSGWVPLAEEGTADKEPVTDVRVRSVQLLCTHSGRLRHTATLIETYPVTFPTKYPSSEKEGTKNVTMATNKVFVSKSNYRPIRMVYDEKGQCKPQETGIPVTVPHLHRYLSNLQKKQMKLKEERGISPHSSLPLADGIYKTTKTYEFSPQGPQETVQKTLISKNLPAGRRPKTSDPTSVGNKMVWKSRPQSGPSRFLTNHNINQKSSGTKSWVGEKQTKKKETQNSNKKEPQQPKVISKQQNSLDREEEEASQVSMETQPSQMIPRVHFESKVNNRNVPLNSILKKSSQETVSNQLVNSYDPYPKEKASNLNTLKNNLICEPPKNIPESCEKQPDKTVMVGHSDLSHLKNTDKLHNTKLDKNSTNDSISYNKGPKNQTGIVFNGIGASSDFCHTKDISEREAQKSLEREVSEIEASTNKTIDTAVNVLNKNDKDEKKRVSFHPQESDSLLSTLSPHTISSSDKDDSFTKEKDKNNSSNLHQEIKNETTTEMTQKESDYYLTTTRYIQTDKKETSSNISPISKDYTNNRRLPGDFSIYRSSATGLSSQPSLNTSVKTEAQPNPTKTKSEKKSPKKAKSSKVKSRSKSNKLTGPPVYLTSVSSQKPIDEDDFECEKLSEKLMENGVYVSWKTIRGGLYPPVGRSLHYEIADTGLVPPSDLLSHPKNWFPKEYKELQQAKKNLERAELILWKQKRAEERKFGSKRKKKQPKKKKK